MNTVSRVRPDLRVDLTNKKFGMLLAVRDAGGPYIRGGRPWVCRCDCGQEAVVPAGTLTKGLKISCGCARRARVEQRNEWRKRWVRPTNKPSRIPLSYGRETDDEMMVEEIRAALESEFGVMRFPAPHFPVFHQSLSSDYELGIDTRRRILADP